LLKTTISLIFLFISATLLSAFTLNSSSTTILISQNEKEVVRTAATLLSGDIGMVTGGKVILIDDNIALSGQVGSETKVIIAGTEEGNPYIKRLVNEGRIDLSGIQGQWESYIIEEIFHPFPGVESALVIAGSDPRGTAFGLLKISEIMGVSPLYWWSDIPVEKRESVTLEASRIIQGPPSVRYRGIFLNDEDWGLRPWAAENMDTELGNIWPNTYEKVFELLLRLKANTIWPAMHEGTPGFFTVEGNKEAADRYGILVSTSHCEPMLRNNVDEWRFLNGFWNYKTNSPKIREYWNERIAETWQYENIYTMGMRGIHDGSMPGGGSLDDKTERLENVIQDQRGILEQYHGSPDAVPQVFIPYKEVLDIYRNNLELPEDITLVWADDNHGYLRQLSNPGEQQRSGNSGVYYHLSYWGSPEDYLWLSTTSPSLIYYEMNKAYRTGADRFWIFNVGDIKPAELEMQFSLDLAYDINNVTPDSLNEYIRDQSGRLFGEELADPITAVRLEHYRLAAAGKPEHLLQVQYSHNENSDQAMERIKQYTDLMEEIGRLSRKIPENLRDAWYQLIEYPVRSAALMNLKFLYSERATLIKRTDRDLSRDYSRLAEESFEEIKVLTNRYNTEIAQGKWNGMMSWHPRNRRVYKMPSRRRKPLLEDTGSLYNAADWVNAEGSGNFTWKVFDGLGSSGKAVSLFTDSEWDSISDKTPAMVTYELDVPAPGNYQLEIRCLPTHPLYAPLSLEYGVSIEGREEILTDIESEAGTKEWKLNVLRGYTGRNFPFTADNSAKLRFSISVYDPGIVFDSFAVIPVKD
jgi:Glycosyl hydrolase family 115/Gylcosyl hydrolase family 115 C-terminal domain